MDIKRFSYNLLVMLPYNYNYNDKKIVKHHYSLNYPYK